MKRKVLLILAAVMMVTLIPLTGCGGGSASDPAAEARAAADGFMSALQAGDIEGVKQYSDPALFEEGGDLASFEQIQNMGDEFAKAVGTDPESLSDTTKTTLEEFTSKIMSQLVKSYEIGEVTQEGDTGTAQVSVTFGFDPEKISDIDANEEMEALATTYMEDHMTELMDAYNNGGEEAVIAKVIDDLLPDLLDKYGEKILSTGEVTNDSTLSLAKKDGKWVVTADGFSGLDD